MNSISWRLLQSACLLPGFVLFLIFHIFVFFFEMLYVSFVLTSRKNIQMSFFWCASPYFQRVSAVTYSCVCVCAHLWCFVFLEFMFKRPFVPFLWHELCIFVSYDCFRIVYMCSVAWLPCCYLSSTTFLADCTYIFSV